MSSAAQDLIDQANTAGRVQRMVAVMNGALARDGTADAYEVAMAACAIALNAIDTAMESKLPGAREVAQGIVDMLHANLGDALTEHGLTPKPISDGNAVLAMVDLGASTATAPPEAGGLSPSQKRVLEEAAADMKLSPKTKEHARQVMVASNAMMAALNQVIPEASRSRAASAVLTTFHNLVRRTKKQHGPDAAVGMCQLGALAMAQIAERAMKP